MSHDSAVRQSVGVDLIATCDLEAVVNVLSLGVIDHRIEDLCEELLLRGILDRTVDFNDLLSHLIAQLFLLFVG